MDGIILSAEQKMAVDALHAWTESHSLRPFRLSGLAGTGKTTIVKAWSEQMSNVAYCAYTGKAAHVMRQKGIPEASTIHRLIYNCFPDGQDSKGRTVFRWERKDELYCDMIVVDEASMVPSQLRSDIQSYGVPVCYVGDHGQLPPVADEADSFMEYSDFRLERIHRQAENNPIIVWAHRARSGEMVPHGHHGTLHRIPKDHLDRVVSATIDHNGKVLCGKNSTRNALNMHLRNVKFPGTVRSTPMFGFAVPAGEGSEIRKGDILVGLKNNMLSGVFNGMLGIVTDVQSKNSETEIVLDTGDGMVKAVICNDTLGTGCMCREHDRLDFGYCLTVHKSQGSEWPCVVLVNERMGMDAATYFRWMYTGITRASQELVIVG